MPMELISLAIPKRVDMDEDIASYNTLEGAGMHMQAISASSDTDLKDDSTLGKNVR